MKRDNHYFFIKDVYYPLYYFKLSKFSAVC